MTHIMQGSYVKPTATFGFYSDNAINYKTGNPVLEKRNNVFGAIILNFGHQWVFGDKFLVDIYYGLGYAFDNVKDDRIIVIIPRYLQSFCYSKSRSRGQSWVEWWNKDRVTH